MRACLPIAVVLAALAATAPVRAQKGPVVVIPGRPDVPVTINGLIVNGAVVYGDWGLARPGHGEIIIDGPVAIAAGYGSPGYFPGTGRAPRYGRQEINPPAQRRPRQSTNFYRDWSIESEFRRPITEYPPFDPPPVVLAPRPRHR